MNFPFIISAPRMGFYYRFDIIYMYMYTHVIYICVYIMFNMYMCVCVYNVCVLVCVCVCVCVHSITTPEITPLGQLPEDNYLPGEQPIRTTTSLPTTPGHLPSRSFTPGGQLCLGQLPPGQLPSCDDYPSYIGYIEL